LLGVGPLNDTRFYSLGIGGAIFLALLRLVLGWHFTMEGAKKLQDPDFSSTGFLRAAKGPFANIYHGSIGDPDGAVRLSPEESRDRFEDFATAATSHYGYDEKQEADAQSAAERRVRELQFFLGAQDDDMKEFDRESKKLEEYRADQKRQAVAFSKKRDDDKEKELRAKLNGWIASADKIAKGFEEELYGIAKADQQSRGLLHIPSPAHNSIDGVIPWLLTTVGILLLLGLLTPFAAFGGAMFLLSVIMSQPPWVPGTDPVYYQSVEFVALLTVAFTLAGRYGGLDYFIESWCCRNCDKSTVEIAPSATAAAS